MKNKPKIGELYKVKTTKALFAFYIKDNSNVILKPGCILLLTYIKENTTKPQFSFDTPVPLDWTCEFLFNGQLICTAFQNSYHFMEFFDKLEKIEVDNVIVQNNSSSI
jgi:hypothetical protein